MKMMESRSARLTLQLALTVTFFLVELIVGTIVNSLALVSDSFHMLSDVLALAVALYAIRVAKRDTSEHMSYGWVRAEIVGAFANAVFLIALCFTIIIDAIQRFFEPEEVSNTLLLLIVGGVGLGINLIGLLFFHEAHGAGGGGHSHSHGHSHGHKKPESQPETSSSGTSNKNKNFNMRGVFLHLLGDALGSVAVMVVGLVLHFAPGFKGGVYLDPALSLFIVALLLMGSVPLARQTANVLLHKVPGKVDVDVVKKECAKVEGVLHLHELHIWQLSDDMFVGSCHLIIDPNADQMTIVSTIKAILHAHDIHETTIQLENPKQAAEGSVDSELQCLLECEKDCEAKTCHPRKRKPGIV